MGWACLLGHKWGEWKTISACSKKRICERCGEKDIQYTHDFHLTGYDEHCVEILTCANCSETKKGKEQHSWSSYAYYEEGCCTQVSICHRCHAHRYLEDVHQMVAHVPENRCEERQICSRCGLEQVASCDHQWHPGLHTYLQCLIYVEERLANRVDELEVILQSPHLSAKEKITLGWEQSQAKLEHSSVLAKKAGLSNLADQDAPARVCQHCLFVAKTGWRA